MPEPCDERSKPRVLVRAVAAVAGCATLLAACGSHSTVDSGATATYVHNVVLAQTGFDAVDVRCPSNVPAAAGGRLSCHFTGPEGPYTAYLRIVNVQGRRVAFRLKTQPSAWPPPSLP